MIGKSLKIGLTVVFPDAIPPVSPIFILLLINLLEKRFQ